MANNAKGTVLELLNKTAMLGKIHNNVDDAIPEFRFPVQMLIEPAELAKILNDKRFVESLFVTKGNVTEPSEAAKELGRMKLARAYDGSTVVITLVSGDDVDFDDCILDSLVFEPLTGGMVGLYFNLYLQPGIGETNLHLQEHQNTEVNLSIHNAKLALKARQKQQELLLGDPDSEYQGGQEEPPPRGERAKPEARKKRANKRNADQAEVH